MRYLGIDYGDKRVGLAISDESGKLAFPYSVIPNSKNLIDEVLDVIKKEKVAVVVIGESTNLDGTPNAIQKDINDFFTNLKNGADFRVVFEPEFWTSAEAERVTGKNKMQDASAAALILQYFLDKERNML